MENVVLCFLCGNDSAKENLEFYNILSSVVPASEKPIHVVLQHLANCIKYKVIFQTETFICAECFKEMSDYDDLMLNLLFSQRRLTVLLQNALMEKQDEKPSVQDEQSMDIQLEFEDDEDDPNLLDAFNPNLDTKEELVEIDDTIIDDSNSASNNKYVTSSKFYSNQITQTERKRPLLECVVCSDVFRTKFLFQNHMSERHNIKQHTCKICGISKKDEEYLKLHMNIHEGKTENECRYCPKRFTRPVNTLRHMRIHWDKKKFQCEKCGERFSLDNMLYNHRLKHEAEENPLICGTCKQSFKSRKTYNHHLLIHQENRPRHHCHLCRKSFTERYTLKMHLKIHSQSQETTSTSIVNIKTCNVLQDSDNYDSDNTCVICNKKYDGKDGLEQHLQDMHDVVLK